MQPHELVLRAIYDAHMAADARRSQHWHWIAVERKRQDDYVVNQGIASWGEY